MRSCANFRLKRGGAKIEDFELFSDQSTDGAGFPWEWMNWTEYCQSLADNDFVRTDHAKHIACAFIQQVKIKERIRQASGEVFHLGHLTL